MQMLPGERLIHESADGAIKVTTHRILHQSRMLGSRGFSMLWLAHVSGVEWGRRTRPVYLWLAAGTFALLLVLAAGMGVSGALFLVGFVPALVFLALYVVTQSRGLRLVAQNAVVEVPRYKGGRLAAEELAELILGLRMEAPAAVEGPRQAPSFQVGWMKRSDSARSHTDVLSKG